MNKKYIVTLTADERVHLHRMISVGKAAARKLLHARILLKADASSEGPGRVLLIRRRSHPSFQVQYVGGLLFLLRGKHRSRA